jgi:tetratricopeptide (TPR) repeat protein
MLSWGARAIAACAGLLYVSGAASASPYSDFNAGIALRGVYDDLALQHFDAALAAPDLLASLRPVALFDRGEIYERQGKYDLALADFSASLLLRPTYDGYLARARLEVVQGHLDPALKDLASASEVRPDLYVARVQRAELLLEHDRFGEALDDESALIALAPLDSSLLAVRSAIYRRMGNFDAALSDADYIINIAPKAANGHYAKAATLQAMGRFDDALAAIDMELDLFPNSVIALMKKGTIQWSAKRFGDADATFGKVQAMDAAYGYAAIWRAIAIRSAGRDVTPDVFEKVDAVSWPGPVIGLYRGRLSATDVMQAAASDSAKARGQLCEANFFVAQWDLLDGKQALARPLLARVLQNCPFDSTERAAAAVQGVP